MTVWLLQLIFLHGQDEEDTLFIANNTGFGALIAASIKIMTFRDVT
jgi:hypothetical protein